MADSTTERFEEFRDYLLLIGRLQLSPHAARRIDLSGVIQQTLLEAHRDAKPDGDHGALLAWLRTLLANNLRDELRKTRAAQRDIRRQVPLQASLDASSARVGQWLTAQQSSPSQQAMRTEELTKLASALSTLPDAERTAIELHHLRGEPLAVVAEQLNRTREAAAALLYRALKRLRKQLNDSEQD